MQDILRAVEEQRDDAARARDTAWRLNKTRFKIGWTGGGGGTEIRFRGGYQEKSGTGLRRWAWVVLTTFVTITGPCLAYFCALLSASNYNLSMSPGLIDKLVNGCYMTILSLSPGTIYNPVIEPCFYLQSCHWAQEPFTILSLSIGTIYNPVIEPGNHLQSCHWAREPFTILSLSLGTIYNLVIKPCFYLQSCHWAREPFTILSLSPVSIYNPVIEP